jgi:hypothetical protein
MYRQLRGGVRRPHTGAAKLNADGISTSTSCRIATLNAAKWSVKSARPLRPLLRRSRAPHLDLKSTGGDGADLQLIEATKGIVLTHLVGGEKDRKSPWPDRRYLASQRLIGPI